jgi:molybdenum cofactor guanylyltransferase
VITAASDTPFLPANLVSRFRAAIDEGSPKLVVAQSEGGLHSVFGLWPISLATDLEDSLKASARKVSEIRQKR